MEMLIQGVFYRRLFLFRYISTALPLQPNGPLVRYFISGKQIHYQSVVSTTAYYYRLLPLQYPRFRPDLPFSFHLLHFNSRSGSNYEQSAGSYNSCPPVRRHAKCINYAN